jgi:hypothetical protein
MAQKALQQYLRQPAISTDKVLQWLLPLIHFGSPASSQDDNRHKKRQYGNNPYEVDAVSGTPAPAVL